MIEVEGLIKDYGTVLALRGLSFHVGAGEVVGFLGPNGAGKSTTLRLLAGFIGPTAGRIRIGGHDVGSASLAARRLLGYLPETSPLYPELRVREYLSFRAALKRVPRRDRAKAVARAMELAAVSDLAEVLIGHLSRGYRQRVGIADALVASPPLLILDEPTAGLDPNQIREVRRLIRELGRDHTILLSTHILPEVEAICDRALVVAEGRLVGAGTLAELREQRRGQRVCLRLRDADGASAASIAATPGVELLLSSPREGGEARVEVSVGGERPETTVEELVTRLVSSGVGVREVTPARATLEEVFAALTEGGGPHGGGGADPFNPDATEATA